MTLGMAGVLSFSICVYLYVFLGHWEGILEYRGSNLPGIACIWSVNYKGSRMKVDMLLDTVAL
jgi:hypothetical protein